MPFAEPAAASHIPINQLTGLKIGNRFFSSTDLSFNMQLLSRYQGTLHADGTVSFSAIEAELRKGRVIGTRIGWSGGGGHFMCIYGCSRVGSTEYVDIDDPIYGKSHIALATFRSSYQGNGSWMHTYFTKEVTGVDIQPSQTCGAVCRYHRRASPPAGDQAWRA